MSSVTEGTVDFKVTGLAEPCHTWYKIIGDLKNSSKEPLIIIHGGPGACHDYLLPLIDLSPSMPLVFYDQIGNGRSTHLPDKAGDEAFWSIDLFKRELDNLIAHLGLKERPIDVYGHSWGGMLAAEWAATPSSANLRRLLPEDVQEVLDRLEKEKDFDSPEYEAAVEVFYKRHLSLARPWPAKEVQAALNWFAKDATTYSTMYGPSELSITGSLRNWSCIPILNKIKVPTLLLNGREDEAQDVAMYPFFEHIEKVKWITLENAAHFSHVDQREKYMQHVTAFLTA
ncbi:hypothetical protein M434DRAFT_34274 [Hypoxylon sp. CO27-5]|nr:hypothetical protein M434DRAFT_34274 [Hypoxylon sp. CO27-5]